MDKSDIDVLLIGDHLITRLHASEARSDGWIITMAPDVSVNLITNAAGDLHFLLIAANGRNSEVPADLGRVLMSEPDGITDVSSLYDDRGQLRRSVAQAIDQNMLLGVPAMAHT